MAKTQNELETRLGKRIDELKWLYYELYHGDSQGCTAETTSWV